MKVNATIHKALQVFGFDVTRVPSPLFHPAPIPLPKEEYQVNKDRIFLKRLQIDIPKDPAHALIAEYHHAKRIVEQLKGKYYYDSNGELKVNVNGVELYITDPEILFIISEVFANGSYNILPAQRDLIVIDIGMNVQKIYAYELFPLTYKQAERNILANTCGGKIWPHAFGLGREETFLELPYATRQKGRMGINGLPKDEVYDQVVMQQVQVKKASSEIKRIDEENPGKYKVCKMDCEGAEYEIMEELVASDTLKLVNAYMIEWHYKKPGRMVEALQNNGFTVFYSTFPSDQAGMLYATRQY